MLYRLKIYSLSLLPFHSVVIPAEAWAATAASKPI
jgi:hypothetical protein